MRASGVARKTPGRSGISSVHTVPNRSQTHGVLALTLARSHLQLHKSTKFHPGIEIAAARSYHLGKYQVFGGVKGPGEVQRHPGSFL
jgi:hypothetical protein